MYFFMFFKKYVFHKYTLSEVLYFFASKPGDRDTPGPPPLPPATRVRDHWLRGRGDQAGEGERAGRHAVIFFPNGQQELFSEAGEEG